MPLGCVVVHTGRMRASKNIIRQEVSLPAQVAGQVRRLAKKRRLSANQMLVELIEEGIETQSQKHQKFLALAENFRAATDPKEAERLGNELGRMVFGG